jgi:hypothetical protein
LKEEQKFFFERREKYFLQREEKFFLSEKNKFFSEEKQIFEGEIKSCFKEDKNFGSLAYTILSMVMCLLTKIDNELHLNVTLSLRTRQQVCCSNHAFVHCDDNV